jgi:threonine dehydratase
MDKTPTVVDVLHARRLLATHLPVTPIWSYPALDVIAGATVYVKHENVQPIGAFKVRGGLTALAGMPTAERERGVVTYSTGNHAQSIAYASRVFGNRCVVVMPEGANEVKVRAVQALGGTVVLHGVDLAGAQAHAEHLAAMDGLGLLSPGDEASLIAGVGTLYLEILEAVPDLDLLVVPMGSGTGAAAACIVAEALAPECRVIAVQSAASRAGHDAWRSGSAELRPNQTVVEGLSTGRSFDLPQHVLRDRLADFLLVSDDEILAAQRLLATHAHTLAEGAGAAALAGVLSRPELFAGKRIAVICTGGNASAREIARLGQGDGPSTGESPRHFSVA